MNRLYLTMLSVVTALLLSITGCANAPSVYHSTSNIISASPTQPTNMYIWRASMGLEVSNINHSLSEIMTLAQQAGGEIENHGNSSEQFASITIRVPSEVFKSTLSQLETMGTVTSKNMTAQDVTEQYIDTEARLKTMIALRDRLRSLLDKANAIADIIAIEKELTRVQGDIDAMQAKITSLSNLVDMATIEVSLQRKKILGPLGYVVKGSWWTIKKLFVLRD